MKKALSLILSLLLLLGCVPLTAFAGDAPSFSDSYEKYDMQAVSEGETEYINALSTDAMASLVMDWIDRIILKNSADFENFEVTVFGAEIAESLPEVCGIDSLVAYAPYLELLGGDFVSFDVSALDSLTRKNGDVYFIAALLEFIADNALQLSKLTAWSSDSRFEAGALGSYIASLDTNNKKYALIDEVFSFIDSRGNLQEKLVNTVASGLYYDVAEDYYTGERLETLDEVFANGFTELFGGLNIFSDTTFEKVRALDLRSTDIYTYFKEVIRIFLEDVSDELAVYHRVLGETYVRAAFYALAGYCFTIGEEVTDTQAIVDEINAAYPDLYMLYRTFGSGAGIKTSDGKYYYFQIDNEGTLTKINEIVWVQAFDVDTESKSSPIKKLLDFIDKDFDVVDDYTDLMASYDEYNGVIGQLNHIIYSMVDMFLTDSAMERLELVDGDNSHLTNNLNKICNVAGKLMEDAGEYLRNAEIVDEELADDVFLYSDYLYNCSFKSPEKICVYLVNLFGIVSEYDYTYEYVDENGNVYYETRPVETDCLEQAAVYIADSLFKSIVNTLNDYLGSNLTVPEKTDVRNVGKYNCKDIIMEKLTAILLELATWFCDDILNRYPNQLIDSLNKNMGYNVPHLSLSFGVEAADSWEGTLEAILDRFFELATGFIAVCDKYTDADIFDRISAVLNAIIPMGTIASNCASEEFAFDVDMVLNEFVFDQLLNGDLSNFLRLFETSVKTQDVAADCSVTLSYIKTLEHVVDSVFPGTIQTEDYTENELVLENFTSENSLMDISVNFANSVNSRKYELIPAFFNLVRETGILPHLATCSHTDMTIEVEPFVPECPDFNGTLSTLCRGCGYYIVDGVAVLPSGHIFDDWYITVEPTCLEGGTKAHMCTCGFIEYKAVKELGHDFSVWYTTIEPECEKEGYEKSMCSRNCGNGIGREIPAKGHNYTDWIIEQEATCTKGEEAMRWCYDCYTGYGYGTAPLGHDYIGEWEVTTPATCTENGLETRACSRCEGDTRVITAQGHSFSDWAVTTPATCTVDGVETRTCNCGEEETRPITAQGHSFSDWAVTTPATCTVDGVETRTCNCGEEETRSITAQGHSFGTWSVTTAATCTKDGVEARVCTCGEEELRIISATGHTDSNADNSCDSCGEKLAEEEDNSIAAKIKAFFQKIIDWFKNLFNFG